MEKIDNEVPKSFENGAIMGACIGASVGLVNGMSVAGMLPNNDFVFAGVTLVGTALGAGIGAIGGGVTGIGLEKFSNGVITVVGMTLNSLDEGISSVVNKTDEKIESIKDKIKSIRHNHINANKIENTTKIKLG